MADEVSIAVVALRADLSEFRKEMKTLGPEAAKAADDMTWAMLRQLKAVEKAQKEHTQQIKKEHEEAAKAAKKAAEDAAAAQKKAAAEAAAAAQKAARATGKSFGEVAKGLMQNQAISQAETIAAMFITVGGAVSQVAMLVTSAIRPVATFAAMFGPSSLLMVGAAAAPFLLLGVASAARGLADSAVEAEDRLKKLGLVTNKSASAELKAYRAATSDLSVAMDELRVAVGEDLAPAFTTLVQEGADALRYFRDLRDAAGQLRHDLDLAWRIITAIGSVGMSELARSTLESADASDRAADSYKAHTDKIAEASRKAADLNNIMAESQAVFDELDLEYDKRLVRLSEEEAALERSRKAEQAAAEAKREHERRIREYTEAVLYQRGIETSLAEARVRQQAEEAEAIEESRLAYLDHYRTLQRASRAQTEQEEQDAQRRIDAMKAAANAAMSTASTLASSFEQLTASSVEYYVGLAAQREAAGESLTLEEERAARRAWAIQKGLAQAQIAIQGIQMAASFVTALSPLLGPAAIPVGVSAAGAFVGVQASLIEQQSPPEFPTGLSSDHYWAGLQRGEMVASRRAAADPEVREAIDAGNEGRRVRRRADRVSVEVSVDRRTGRLRVRQSRPGKKDRRR